MPPTKRKIHVDIDISSDKEETVPTKETTEKDPKKPRTVIDLTQQVGKRQVLAEGSGANSTKDAKSAAVVRVRLTADFLTASR